MNHTPLIPAQPGIQFFLYLAPGSPLPRGWAGHEQAAL